LQRGEKKGKEKKGEAPIAISSGRKTFPKGKLRLSVHPLREEKKKKERGKKGLALTVNDAKFSGQSPEGGERKRKKESFNPYFEKAGKEGGKKERHLHSGFLAQGWLSPLLKGERGGEKGDHRSTSAGGKEERNRELFPSPGINTGACRERKGTVYPNPREWEKEKEGLSHLFGYTAQIPSSAV